MSKKLKNVGLTATALGGLDEIGLNMMVYECDDDMILVDVGLTFPDEQAPGTDLVIPDAAYIRENIHRLKAIFITHAHEDHIGAMPYLWDEMPVPVYTMPFTARVLRGKAEQASLPRDEFIINEISAGDICKAGKFEVEFVPITHSIPGAALLIIRTPYGVVVNTGDYKLDEDPVIGQATSMDKLRSVGDEGVLALFSDSTDIFGEGRKPTEHELVDSLSEIVADQDQAIFFSPFASNVERIITITEVAATHGRKVCYMGRSILNMVQNARECGFFPEHLSQHIIDLSEVKKVKRSELLVVLTGSQAQPNAALSRVSGGEAFRGVQIKEGDTVILSARRIPGNERAIDKLMNRLTHTGAKVLSGYNSFVHVGGHAQKEEVEDMYRAIRPKFAIPSYGTYFHTAEHAKFIRENIKGTKALHIKNGEKLHLAPEKPHVVGKVRYGRNYVDGFNILDEDKFILRERRQMSFDGLVTVTMGVDADTKVKVFGPLIQTRGIIDETLQPEILATAVAEVNTVMKRQFSDGRINDVKLAEEMMRQGVRRAFRNERGRKPVTLPLVVEV